MNVLARLATHADKALDSLAALAPGGALAGLSGAALLNERAELGAAPAERSCRLLETADGWLALNLARGEDWDLLPAWLECEVAAQWSSVERAVRKRPAASLVERGREIGLALALDQPPSPPAPPRQPMAGDSSVRRNDARAPRVVDLSSLWAGPLCGRLLVRLGAEVIKVEGAQRPDGARGGSPAFFERLNSGKTCVTLDFASAAGRRDLLDLLRGADIVIEASRPRALRQLGIHAERLLKQNPRKTWISISGYGRDPARENWIAYGDDAGVAAGLSHVHWLETGERAIVGDAVADPLTGIQAALVAWRGWQSGQGGLVSVALCDVVSQALAGSYSPSASNNALQLGENNEDRHQG